MNGFWPKLNAWLTGKECEGKLFCLNFGDVDVCCYLHGLLGSEGGNAMSNCILAARQFLLVSSKQALTLETHEKHSSERA